MADFNSIVQDVMTITNRADLVAETQLAVKSATLQLHRQDYFYKDIFETVVQFTAADYLQAIEYKALFPRYRALKYLRKFDPANPQTSGFDKNAIKIITPDEIVDSYNQLRTDVAYVAGNLIQIKSSTQIQYASIGVYLNPDVTATGYNSWIADEAYYAIVYQAASIVFGTVLRDKAGQDANATMAANEFIMVKNSNIIAEGY